MNILQIIHRFLPATIGGSEIYTYQLSKELNKTHNVSLMFTTRDLSKNQYSTRKGEYKGLPFTEIINNNFYNSFEDTYQNDIMDKIFLAVLEQMRPDVIHVQHLGLLSVNFIKLAKERDIPVVFTLHDFWLMCPSYIRLKPDMTSCFEMKEEACASCIADSSKKFLHLNRPGIKFLNTLLKFTPPGTVDILKKICSYTPEIVNNKYLIFKGKNNGNHKNELARIQARNDCIKNVCSQVDMFVSPSHLLRNEFIKFGISADKIIHSRHGHITNRGRSVKKQSSKLRFGFVGVISEHKGVDILIEAFNRIQDNDVELNIYGHNDVNLRYVTRVHKINKNSATRFKGKFDHTSISDVYAEIDVLIMPAICFENSPMTICEALMARTPVITSNFGGMAELIQHEKNGLLFKVGDTDDLYKKIKMVIDNRQLVSKLAKGIEPVKTIEKDVEDFEKRYESLLCRV